MKANILRIRVIKEVTWRCPHCAKPQVTQVTEDEPTYIGLYCEKCLSTDIQLDLSNGNTTQ